jgi:hypothetical protein
MAVDTYHCNLFSDSQDRILTIVQVVDLSVCSHKTIFTDISSHVLLFSGTADTWSGLMLSLGGKGINVHWCD